MQQRVSSTFSGGGVFDPGAAILGGSVPRDRQDSSEPERRRFSGRRSRGNQAQPWDYKSPVIRSATTGGRAIRCTERGHDRGTHPRRPALWISPLIALNIDVKSVIPKRMTSGVTREDAQNPRVGDEAPDHGREPPGRNIFFNLFLFKVDHDRRPLLKKMGGIRGSRGHSSFIVLPPVREGVDPGILDQRCRITWRDVAGSLQRALRGVSGPHTPSLAGCIMRHLTDYAEDGDA